MRKILNAAAIALAHLAMTYAALYLSFDSAARSLFTGEPEPLAGRLAEALAWVLTTPVLSGALAAGLDPFAGYNLEIAAVANSLAWGLAATLGWGVLSRRALRRHAPTMLLA